MHQYHSRIGLLTALLTLGSGLLVAATTDPGQPLGALDQTARPVQLSAAPDSSQARVQADYGKLPYTFQTNGGQVDAAVKFLARGPGYSLFLTPGEAVLSLRTGQPQAPAQHRPGAGPAPRVDPTPTAAAVPPAVLRLSLVGANPAALIRGEAPLLGTVNYLRGRDPAAWRTGLSTYAKVRYESVYPGIDLVYYGHEGELEYDLVLAPGADPKVIALAFDGADALRLDASGNLVLTFQGGELVQQAPRVYQEANGERTLIPSRYLLADNQQVALALGDYDTTRTLVIDPVLSYSTYLGGTGVDRINGIAVDAAGNTYVTGQTWSDDFPTTTDAVQPAPAPGSLIQDAFVAKLDPTGATLLYATYLGGNAYDVADSIAVDAAGNAYVVGATGSADFPLQNALQPAHAGGFDLFVAKLNPTGSELVYSTYLGGSTNETITEIGGSSIAVDNTGSAYVTGGSDSVDFPTYRAQQATLAGAGPDAVVAKLNPAGTALVYSTYLGGTDYDEAAGIAVDAAGNAYVHGITSSTDFPTTSGALQPTANGSFDAFVAKLNSTGSALVYATYLGGSADEQGLGIALNGAGHAYLSGNTTSTNFPTRNPLQSKLGGSATNNPPDAYVAQLDAAGSALVYATYLGGSGWEWGSNIAVDATGSAVVTGDSGSPDFPTKSPLMPVPQGDVMDAFVTQLDATGATLIFSSHLGVSGPGDTSGRGVGLDAAGNLYVAGQTGAGFPTTGGALQPDFGGLNDGFIVKIAPGAGASVDAPLWLVALGDVTGDGTQAVAALFEDVAAQTVTGVIRQAVDGTLIQTIDFGATYAPLEVAMVPDLDGNGAPELALLRFTADAQVQVEVRDTRTGERRTALTFAAAFLPKRLAVVPDLNGNGAVELAVLGIHGSTGAVAAEIRDARTGVRLRQVYFDKTYQPLDFAVIADVNGNGAAELAVLGIKSGSQPKVELRDTQSGQLVKNLWSPKIFTPIALAAIPDTNGNGTPEIAVLGRNTSMNVELRTLDAGTAAQLGIAYYSRTFTPLQLAALPDLNGNGVAELAVLSRDTAGSLKTELRDAVTGTLVRNIWFNTLTPKDLAVLPDLNGNSRPEIAVLGVPPAGGAQVLIKDAGTQAQISRLDF